MDTRHEVTRALASWRGVEQLDNWYQPSGIEEQRALMPSRPIIAVADRRKTEEYRRRPDVLKKRVDLWRLLEVFCRDTVQSRMAPTC